MYKTIKKIKIKTKITKTPKHSKKKLSKKNYQKNLNKKYNLIIIHFFPISISNIFNNRISLRN